MLVRSAVGARGRPEAARRAIRGTRRAALARRLDPEESKSAAPNSNCRGVPAAYGLAVFLQAGGVLTSAEAAGSEGAHSSFGHDAAVSVVSTGELEAARGGGSR